MIKLTTPQALAVVTAAWLVLAATTTSATGQTAPDPWIAVDRSLGRAGTTQPDGVRRYSFPRSDLKVQLEGVTIRPALALGSWLAFQPMGKDVMVMGDLVLTHEEVNPVLSELLKSGIRVTALHNHLLRSAPATMYMHVEGHGNAAAVAASIHSALTRSRTPLGTQSVTAAPALGLDTAMLDRVMGKAGKANGGVYQLSFPRVEALTSGGMPAPASMGTATAINIQSAPAGKAVATGDFVLLSGEVDPVMKALSAAGIEVTALHNHMLDDQPRLFFMHFWGHDDPARLATGLRAAVDAMKTGTQAHAH